MMDSAGLLTLVMIVMMLIMCGGMIAGGWAFLRRRKQRHTVGEGTRAPGDSG
jgi:hypothetical protein